MSADEDPYHCAECGFCRVGGRENFRHCQDCGMCIDALLFDDHNCKSGKYMSNCPVCQEDLFSSRMASHEMPCGHAIHWRKFFSCLAVGNVMRVSCICANTIFYLIYHLSL
jgi:RING finger/CHY zinc finger protein 1